MHALEEFVDGNDGEGGVAQELPPAEYAPDIFAVTPVLAAPEVGGKVPHDNVRPSILARLAFA